MTQLRELRYTLYISLNEDFTNERNGYRIAPFSLFSPVTSCKRRCSITSR